MSFVDAYHQRRSSFETKRNNSVRTDTRPESSRRSFDGSLENLGTLLFSYSENVDVLSAIVNNLKSGSANREKVDQLRTQMQVLDSLNQQCSDSFLNCAGAIIDVSPEVQRRQKLKLDKLEKDLGPVRSRHHTMARSLQSEFGAQNNSTSQTRSSISSGQQSRNDPHESEGVHREQKEEIQIATQRLQVVEDDIEEMIIRERDREVTKIHDDLLAVNELYKEIGNIVQNQEGNIAKIEKSTEEARYNAEEGVEQLVQANNNSGNCVLC